MPWAYKPRDLAACRVQARPLTTAAATGWVCATGVLPADPQWATCGALSSLQPVRSARPPARARAERRHCSARDGREPAGSHTPHTTTTRAWAHRHRCREARRSTEAGVRARGASSRRGLARRRVSGRDAATLRRACRRTRAHTAGRERGRPGPARGKGGWAGRRRHTALRLATHAAPWRPRPTESALRAPRCSSP